MNQTILVAGASGYIGKALLPILRSNFPTARIIALTREATLRTDLKIDWINCDLFSESELQKALPSKIDFAYYLVHSMGPSARLDQGSFADYDLILADNFARVIEQRQIRQLIYLGGLIPESPKLSKHLRSRKEVEEVFQSYKIPTTCFRAGLILGEEGSSSQILLKLVRRLPVMICPAWTKTFTTPVDLATVVDALTSASLDLNTINRTYDLAGCKPITYLEMMKQTAQKLGLKRFILPVPFFSLTLSRLWVSLISSSPKSLVYPLIESLEHPMVAREEFLYRGDSVFSTTYQDLLNRISLGFVPVGQMYQSKLNRKLVRSVQRLPIPHGATAQEVSQRYGWWLTKKLKPLVRVTVSDQQTLFYFIFKFWVLLRLKVKEELSDTSRQTMDIVDGLLVSKKNKGVFEFRIVLNGRFAISAIHDYGPSLPWFIYRFTQAPLHLIIMAAFRLHLKNQESLEAYKKETVVIE